MRKLMEAVERLNEYLVRRGDKFDALLSLNVYEDILDDANENFLDFHGDARWQRVVNNYKGHALEQAKQIKAYAAKGRTLTDAEAAYAEETWYDGSDAYDNVEDAVEWLPEIFDAQLEAVEEILHGNIEGMHEANQGGKTEHSGAKKGKGAYYGRKKEAKRDSNKNRRNADKAQTKEISMDEGKDSAALHRVNANYSALKNDLARLVMEYRNDPDFDGIYLLDSLESLVERYTD